MWIGVTQRFAQFNRDLVLTVDQVSDGLRKQHEARKVLQRAYYGEATDNPPGIMVGSWGKLTNRRPPFDLDVFFDMPPADYGRFQAREGNKQSALLQEVKGVLQDRWAQTDMRGDGQVVQVGFNTIMLEIVPAFRLVNGQYAIPDTNGGGRWRTVDPLAEMHKIDDSDRASSGNARQLMRMMKCWRDHCNVPLDSFKLEHVVADFMVSYRWRDESHFYYDWFVRDFFSHLVSKAGSFIVMPGTYDIVDLGNDWLS